MRMLLRLPQRNYLVAGLFLPCSCRLSTSFTPKPTRNTFQRQFTTSSTVASAAKDVTPVIVGGGISGLATAAALQNIAGVSCQILETCTLDEFKNNKAGAGAQLGPNGLKALRAIGGEELMQQCIKKGSVLKGNAIVVPGMPEPMVIPDTTEEETGLPQVFIRWGLLRELLSDQLDDGCEILTGTEHNICGYEVKDDGNVQIISKNKNVDHKEANLIVSAEGVRSKFRYFVNNDKCGIGQDEDINFLIEADIKETGRTNIKAVVPKVMDPESFKSGYTYAWFAQDGGVGCFAGPAGDGHSYWAISIADSVNEETKESVPFIAEDHLRNDLDAVKSELLNRLRGLGSEDCKFAIDLIEDTNPMSVYASRSAEQVKIGPYLQKDGKVVLVGDSAHAMPLSYGQSAAFALEDAAVLACCIRDNNSVESALNAYSERRVSRCVEMTQRSVERAAKAMKGEKAEDVSKWIFQWEIDE
mmetsp:Transcript_33296/g.48811  ORF Transcript_33296/g.48811 Transcript_33296/m.48811 type:complete len:472 (-) Transcript_33296:73-1488(-)